MEDGAEFSGRTVEDAIAQAEAELGVSRDNLSIDVLAQGSRGLFGIGAENARIRARRGAAAVAPASTDASVSGPASSTYSPAAPSAPSAESVQSNGDLTAQAREVLEDLLQSMGFDADISVRSTQNPIILSVSGDNLGVLIGRRGDNLAALQFMLNLILSKHRRQWPRVVIDVENYRARREESLRSLADRIAYRVRRNQKAFTLEAMPASDRRVIHLTLRDRPDIETYSIGEGPARRVVVAPKRESRSAPQEYF